MALFLDRVGTENKSVTHSNSVIIKKLENADAFMSAIKLKDMYATNT